MLNYVWSENYSVGDPVFDDHHKNLISLFNQLSKLLYQPNNHDALLNILKELKAYTVFHFGTEEKRMLATNYPGFATHKEAHTEFVEKVSEFYALIDKDSETVSEDLFLFLNQWLISHIQTLDREYMGKI